MITFHRIQKDLRRHKVMAFSLAIVGMMVVAAVTAPWVAPFGPLEISDELLQPPSYRHWFGTDQLGRDILSRVMYGARLSLVVALLSVGLALLAGGTIGLIAGYLGGWVDTVLSRCVDVMFAIPEVLLALVVMSVIGIGLGKITLAIGIVYTPIFARVCRGSVVAARVQPYVEAARALGLPNSRIMLGHVLPAAFGPLIIQTTLSLAFAILAETALSFLGLSGQADAPSWGMMLRQGKDMMELAWWVAVFPGVVITLTVVSFNLVGDGLRDALDPRR